MSKYINAIIVDTGATARIYAHQFSEIFKAPMRLEQLQQAFDADWLALPDMPDYSIKAVYQGSILLFTVAENEVPIVTYCVCKKSQDRHAAWQLIANDGAFIAANDAIAKAPSCPYVAIKITNQACFAQAGKPISHWLELGLQFAWGWIRKCP